MPPAIAPTAIQAAAARPARIIPVRTTRSRRTRVTRRRRPTGARSGSRSEDVTAPSRVAMVPPSGAPLAPDLRTGDGHLFAEVGRLAGSPAGGGRALAPNTRRSARSSAARATRTGGGRTRSSRTVGARSLPDPVHGRRFFLREARTFEGPDAHVRAGRWPLRAARSRGLRPRRAVGGEEIRPHLAPQRSGRSTSRGPVAVRSLGRAEGCLRTRRGARRFVGPGGDRCPARRQLEYHHVEPHARGGKAVLANIQLMCRAHNAHLAERDFGAAHMARFRNGPEPSRPPPAAPSRA